MAVRSCARKEAVAEERQKARKFLAHLLAEEVGPADEVGQRLVGNDALAHSLAQGHALRLLLLTHLPHSTAQRSM